MNLGVATLVWELLLYPVLGSAMGCKLGAARKCLAFGRRMR